MIHPWMSAGFRTMLKARLSNDNISHGFFGRQGGVSTGLYDSLNCGRGTRDEPEAINENRLRACVALGAKPENLLTLYQVHSNICVDVTDPWQEPPKADAMVTDKAGLTLGILTADCAPVLFYGLNHGRKPVIGAAHAGWRGALGGVLESTVQVMVARGCVPESICAAVGPCIGAGSYEVSPGFEKPFLEDDPVSSGYFRSSAGRTTFDLPGYTLFRLRRAGLSQVSAVNADTLADETGYFSYRRSVQRQEPDYGRQISAIVINNFD